MYLNYFGSKRNNFLETALTDLPRDRSEYATRTGLILCVHQDNGILVETNVRTILPTKGIPLPFISYGGSSLVPTLAGVGILLNISQYAALGRRAGFEADHYEEEWEDKKRSKKRRLPRQRAAAVARPRYG